MLCFNCYSAHLLADGPNIPWQVPAAITVYHGRALCRACLIEFLNDVADPTPVAS